MVIFSLPWTRAGRTRTGVGRLSKILTQNKIILIIIIYRTDVRPDIRARLPSVFAQPCFVGSLFIRIFLSHLVVPLFSKFSVFKTEFEKKKLKKLFLGNLEFGFETTKFGFFTLERTKIIFEIFGL